MVKILKFALIILFFTIINTEITMALEEPKYEIIKSRFQVTARTKWESGSTGSSFNGQVL